MTTIHIDATRPQGTISPLWFGHNLEYTRSVMYQGLSAQLLRNRKFAGKPERTGNAVQWYRIGPREAFFDLSGSDAYTRHVDPRSRRVNELSAQKIQITSAETCGLGQRDLPLFKDRAYELRLVLRADCDLRVSAQVLGGAGKPAYAGSVCDVHPGDWQTHVFTFNMPATDPAACLEITFSGPGTLVIGAVSLLPADHFYGMRRDVINLLKQIHVPILRWPGGNFAGDFRWQDGLLPVDQRGPLLCYTPIESMPHTNGCDEHEVGIDEFMALCRELGAEPFISVNLGYEGPQEAAAWVEYCNGAPETEWGAKRAARGHAEPYHVHYWSVGNEMGYGHMEGPNTPAGYAAKARDTALAMRATDASLFLVLSGLYDFDTAWYTECLVPMAGLIQAVSDHRYTPTLAGYLGEEGLAECRRLASEPLQALTRLRHVRQYTDAHLPGNSISISFDEWNVWYAWYRDTGVNEGLHTAGMLNMFIREAQRLNMCIGCFFEPVNEGAIAVAPDRAWLTASGQAFALFGAHYGNAGLPLEGAGDDVDAAASLDASRGRVIVTLVNKDPSAAHDVAVTLEGASAGAYAGGVLLSAESFLPGSTFTQTRLHVTPAGKGAWTVHLPALGVAKLEIEG
jgi:alpha-N-arabinofuranosidase